MSAPMICCTCNEEITDSAMKAGEKLYHENHFLCCVCQTGLKSAAVYTKNDQLYCEADYMSKYVPVCARCEQYITQVGTISYPTHPITRYGRSVSEPWTRRGTPNTSSATAAWSSSPAA